MPEPEAPMMEITSPLFHGEVDVAQHLVAAEGSCDRWRISRIFSPMLSDLPSLPCFRRLLAYALAGTRWLRSSKGVPRSG